MGAERIAALWWVMAGGALLIWVLVVGLSIYAIRVSPEAHGEGKARWLIIGGGAIVPTVVLGALLSHGLSLMPELLAHERRADLTIHVSGEQWWWRVEYVLPDGRRAVTANEVRLPVGRAAELILTSPDVIHSFWIPPLGGKLDMIPGRQTRLVLEPTRTGTFRGACAEYCGTSHALMALDAVVLEPEAFARWLDTQAAPAREPATPLAREGAALFLGHGCGACHTVRGTQANGGVGPDLTHVGGRLTLAAGTLRMSEAALARWIARPAAVKPGVHMPAFGMLPDGQLRALAAYLAGLE